MSAERLGGFLRVVPASFLCWRMRIRIPYFVLPVEGFRSERTIGFQPFQEWSAALLGPAALKKLVFSRY